MYIAKFDNGHESSYTQILIPDLRKILPFYGLSGMTTSKVV